MDELIDFIRPSLDELGHPEIIWYRGHAESHKLLPSILKFDDGFENEPTIFNKYIKQASAANTHSDWLTLIEMHHSYVPTRLLAWTHSFAVSLFCSIIRESDKSSIFMLDPVRLNQKSKLANIININANSTIKYEQFYIEKNLNTPRYPISIQEHNNSIIPTFKGLGFTVHNNDLAPLEIQCPDCVKKFTLSNAQKKKAKQVIASMEWLNFSYQAS